MVLITCIQWMVKKQPWPRFRILQVQSNHYTASAIGGNISVHVLLPSSLALPVPVLLRCPSRDPILDSHRYFQVNGLSDAAAAGLSTWLGAIPVERPRRCGAVCQECFKSGPNRPK